MTTKTMYLDKETYELLSYKEMEEYCRENYDYGDPTNIMTYMSNWWEEYGFKKIEK